jgi:hypothetical protein
MKKHRKFLLPFLGLLMTACLQMLPAVHWRLAGWWRGEPFYGGRPASYWGYMFAHSEIIAGPDGKPYYRVQIPLLTRLQYRLGLRPTFHTVAVADLPGSDRDPGAVPVLTALLGDEDYHVRLSAAHSLGRIGPAAAVAVPELLRLAQDPKPVDPLDREIYIIEPLRRIDPAAADRVPATEPQPSDRPPPPPR